MKVNLANSAGFCFGVRRAINIAIETAKTNQPVFMLGDIVHNEEVVKRIQESGIKKTDRLCAGKGKTLLIRAHGCSNKTLRRAKKLGYSIIDATCPTVKEIHAIVKKLENQGFKIVVIGDKFHDEVKGIVGQLKTKAIIIDSLENIPIKKLKLLRKAGVVVQSTQNLDKVLKIIRILRKNVEELEFHNTICKPTRSKQNEVKVMPLKNDVMIIIGSKTSANTRRIYEISKSLNKRSYWVNSSREIKKSWLAKAKNAGITAGASTPESTIKEVLQKIKTLCAA
ncbi:MAG: 4-hydroxy-3-methylbut-2-enyl diphosphate reductase [Candidatus Omnitrophica bacterium]|jgi:4-hydroxy-3-methylbut-2-enyl diphosphate reductase|nr:4-hydroxy-3-methylbut-2-enyl diphosphate reductase [Candidatus Omnitrophota bacterium]